MLGALLAQPAVLSVPVAFVTMVLVSLRDPERPVGTEETMLALHEAERAGVSKPVLYECYDNKDDVLRARMGEAGFARVSQKFGSGERTLNYIGAGQLFGFDEIAHNFQRPQDPVPYQHTLRAIGWPPPAAAAAVNPTAPAASRLPRHSARWRCRRRAGRRRRRILRREVRRDGPDDPGRGLQLRTVRRHPLSRHRADRRVPDHRRTQHRLRDAPYRGRHRRPGRPG